MRTSLLAALLLACSVSEPAPTTSSVAPSSTASARPTIDANLEFSIEGKRVRSLSTQELIAQVGTVTFTQRDPYYNKKKTFLALPLRKVLESGFAGRNLALEAQHFVLRAIDGYTVPIDGKRLMEEGAHLAIDDTDVADGWQPISDRQVDPGPFYMVWSGEAQQDHTLYPRPWQLQTIEVSRFENSFPKVVPEGADEAAQRGFAIFRQECIRCHSINQQGGKVGPDLNVPKSVVEYREEAFLKAYIKNPRSFRYGTMPDNPHLGDAQLADIVAYFRAMRDRKQDPAADKKGPPP
jgi:mono/diheme cytochrome c family protein